MSTHKQVSLGLVAASLAGVAVCMLALGPVRDQRIGFALFIATAMIVFVGFPWMDRATNAGSVEVTMGAHFAMAFLGLTGAILAYKVSDTRLKKPLQVLGGIFAAYGAYVCPVVLAMVAFAPSKKIKP
jgi:hypothetical protein